MAPRFNTHRMVAEYTREFYSAAAEKCRYFNEDAMAKAKALSTWEYNMKRTWPKLAIKDVMVNVKNGEKDHPLNPKQSQLKVGSRLTVTALINLDCVSPHDVSVQLYHGPVNAWGDISNGSATRLDYKEAVGQNGEHWFTGSLTYTASGRQGFAVRLLPNHPDLINPYELGLILWETVPPK